MSVSLRAEESAASGLKRIFFSHLHSAGECLADDGHLTDAEIHQARKSIKRARATLRLLRPGLARATFRKINLSLRDAARPLTQVRDAKALLDSLGSLRKHFEDIEECLPFDAIEHELRRERTRSRRGVSSHANNMEQLRHGLRRIEAKGKRASIEADEWGLVSPALDRIYRNARRESVRARRSPSDEHLHEWRKQVKHFWYSMQILAPLRPGRIGEVADLAHKLADYLGDDHDLAVLHQYIVATADGKSSRALTALITQRRSDLQDRAFAVGERLFNDKPKDFVQSMRSLWRFWRESTTVGVSSVRHEIDTSSSERHP